MLWYWTSLTKHHPWTCPTPEPVFHIFHPFTHVWVRGSVFLCLIIFVWLCDAFGLGQRLQECLSHLAVCESAFVCVYMCVRRLRALLAGSPPWSSHSDKTDPTIASRNTGSHVMPQIKTFALTSLQIGMLIPQCPKMSSLQTAVWYLRTMLSLPERLLKPSCLFHDVR